MSDFFDEGRDPYESQFTYGAAGRLIVTEAATLNDLNKKVPIVIDGKPGTVTKAVPATDDQGNVKHDAQGDVVPRLTTIYDAALQLLGVEETRKRIPLLCHQHHLTPIGVCRVCSVATSSVNDKGDHKFDPKLAPACQAPINDEKLMYVHTRASDVEYQRGKSAGRHVDSQVSVLLELLAVEHLTKQAAAQQDGDERSHDNELVQLLRFAGMPETFDDNGRYRPATNVFRPQKTALKLADYNGKDPIIRYDPNACVMCDRCVRGCSEVKPFRVIGHTGFGNQARVSFDLGKTMQASECVSCGECATSCPTGALTFERKVYTERNPPWKSWREEGLPAEPAVVRAQELTRTPSPHVNALFAEVSFAYLRWNDGAVGRLTLTPGQRLCKKDDFGSTAFLIESGKLEVMGIENPYRTPDDVIVGELACLSHLPRSADLIAAERTQVLVVKRNLLNALQRNAHAREVLGPVYTARALSNALSSGALFRPPSDDKTDDKQKAENKEMNDRCVAFLKREQASWEADPCAPSNARPLEFLQVNPRQTIIRQGNSAEHFYVIYRGHVSVEHTDELGHAVAHDYLGPGQHFGEIGLLSAKGVSAAVEAAVAKEKPGTQGKRTATCVALDHVELLRVGKAAFKALLDKEPLVRSSIEARALELIEKNKQPRNLTPFTQAGLYQGRNLLVLDLERCTRCQECVKGCSDTHDGVSRLILEGNRFGKYLVPSACRSCHDPECLVGCPVDAIHRRPSVPGRPGVRPLAVVIDDHCIGCGLCAHNCPFGSIHVLKKADAPGSFRWVYEGDRAATNCNLCEDKAQGGDPFCVSRCPHDAAIRLDGFDLAWRAGLTPEGAATKK